MHQNFKQKPEPVNYPGVTRDTVVVSRLNQDDRFYDPRRMKGLATQDMTIFSDPKHANVSPLLGLTFRDYETLTSGFSELNNLLGAGSTGCTFRGTHQDLELVVKKINANTKLEKEKRLQECRNPFVLPVWDVCKQGESLIVYPFMKNGNLYDAVVKGQKTIAYRKRIAIALNVVNGLSFLHSKGFVYRQLKSSSILLDENLCARLGDYGLVKESYDTDYALGYVCPKFIADGKVRPENDLWGLGVVMLELLTGLSGSDEERNDLTVRLGISELLDKPSEAVKTIFGNDMIVDVIANAGWPSTDDRQLAQEFARLAVLCMNNTTLNDRISLKGLGRALKMLFIRAERSKPKDELPTLSRSGSQCEYCLRQKASPLALPCGHSVACVNCLRTCDSLVCPLCSAANLRLAGNAQTFALVISGKGELPKDSKKGLSPDEQVFLQDSKDLVDVLTDKSSVCLEENQVYLMIASAKEKENCSFNNIRKKLFELKMKFQKLREDMKKEDSNHKLTLLIFLTGRFKNNGEMLIPGSTNLKSAEVLKELKEVDTDNMLIFLSGCDSQSFFGTDAFSKGITNERQPTRSSHTPPTPRNFLSGPQGRPHSFALADRAQIAPASGKLRFLSETAGMFKKFALSSDDKEKPSSLWMKSSTTVYCYSPDSQDGFTVEPTASAGPRNSFFVKYLLNAIGGATKCYQPAEDKEVDPLRPDNPCNTCMKLNERIHNHAFLQLGEILSYASDHLKKHNMVYPKLIYNSGGNSLLFSFGGKAKVYP